ncbi:MAG TPA: hypothetical protein VGE52_06465 [Pirellulales bacterium]
MPYQYYCPCGQLLEGHESAAGQHVQCPYCQQVFVQPAPPNVAPAAGQYAAPQPGGFAPAPQFGAPDPQVYGQPQPGAYGQPGYGAPQPGYGAPGQYGAPAGYDPNAAMAGAAGMAPPGMGAAPGVGGDPLAGMGGGMMGGVDPNLDPVVQVVCTNCKQAMPAHKSSMGQDAICPFCNTQITLHYEDTLEYRAEREEYLRQKDELIGKKALNWAIAAAILVVIGMLTMVILTVAGKK